MGSSPSQGLGWVCVPAHGLKSQSEVHSFTSNRERSNSNLVLESIYSVKFNLNLVNPDHVQNFLSKL